MPGTAQCSNMKRMNWQEDRFPQSENPLCAISEWPNQDLSSDGAQHQHGRNNTWKRCGLCWGTHNDWAKIPLQKWWQWSHKGNWKTNKERLNHTWTQCTSTKWVFQEQWDTQCVTWAVNTWKMEAMKCTAKFQIRSHTFTMHVNKGSQRLNVTMNFPPFWMMQLMKWRLS